jgi:hypothetical protein
VQTSTAPRLEEARVAAWGGAFADRMVGVLDDASLALLTSVGHRSGLFEAMAGLGPASSTEIARAAVLDERYQVTGRAVSPRNTQPYQSSGRRSSVRRPGRRS